MFQFFDVARDHLFGRPLPIGFRLFKRRREREEPFTDSGQAEAIAAFLHPSLFHCMGDGKMGYVIVKLRLLRCPLE